MHLYVSQIWHQNTFVNISSRSTVKWKLLKQTREAEESSMSMEMDKRKQARTPKVITKYIKMQN